MGIILAKSESLFKISSRSLQITQTLRGSQKNLIFWKVMRKISKEMWKMKKTWMMTTIRRIIQNQTATLSACPPVPVRRKCDWIRFCFHVLHVIFFMSKSNMKIWFCEIPMSAIYSRKIKLREVWRFIERRSHFWHTGLSHQGHQTMQWIHHLVCNTQKKVILRHGKAWKGRVELCKYLWPTALVYNCVFGCIGCAFISSILYCNYCQCLGPDVFILTPNQ